ncbi:hypothetical protein BH20CHL4_BH20CHL4_14260 [soil metagenome]
MSHPCDGGVPAILLDRESHWNGSTPRAAVLSNRTKPYYVGTTMIAMLRIANPYRHVFVATCAASIQVQGL